jgi:hypothetical protein
MLVMRHSTLAGNTCSSAPPGPDVRNQQEKAQQEASVIRHPFTRVAALALLFVLASCGGGGGGDGGSNGGGSAGGNDNKSLTLSTNTVSLELFDSDYQTPGVVRVSWTDSRVAGVVVGSLPGTAPPSWLLMSTSRLVGAVDISIGANTATVPPGIYGTTLRIVTTDASQSTLAQQDVQVTLRVVNAPAVATQSLAWVETDRPADRNISVTLPSGVLMSGAVTNVPWLHAAVLGDTIILSGNASSSTLPPGSPTALLTTTFRLAGVARTVTSQINVSVTRALAGPVSLSYQVTGSTTPEQLTGLTSTITSATGTATNFTAESNVPWLSVTGANTASPNNLTASLSQSAITALPAGAHTATVTIVPANGAQPLQIPVTLDMRLPEVHFVAPVAFTDTLLTDYVIVRGRGFSAPGFELLVDGAAVSGAMVVNDSQIRFIPGARSVGDHPVSAPNALGLARDSAMLRVAEPANYPGALVPAEVGLVPRMIASPINRMLFAARCYFCTVFENQPVGATSVVQRFSFEPVTQQWARVERFYANLHDIALSPDESQLIVLTRDDLRIVDPATLNTLATYAMPRSVGGIARQLAVLNNGVVIVDEAQLAFSLRTRTFVDLPLNSGGGVAASLDGSRAIYGRAATYGDRGYGYLDASTMDAVMTNTNEQYSSGILSRHATTGFMSSYVLDANLAIVGQLPFSSNSGDLSPDGRSAWGVDFSTGTLRGFDLTGPAPYAEFPAIPVAPQLAGRVARLIIDPSGKVSYLLGERYLQVVRLP